VSSEADLSVDGDQWQALECGVMVLRVLSNTCTYGGTQKRWILFVLSWHLFWGKKRKEWDDFLKITRTWISSRGDKAGPLSVSTLISVRIPLYCKVDKLTNLTLHIRLSSVTKLSTEEYISDQLSQ
jgi:hypothetical protein